MEDEPWGFAPFHYGRWVQLGSAWGWLPGPIVALPCYAPALVVFVDGAAVAYGGGAEGWFPPGPGEPHFPLDHHNPHQPPPGKQTKLPKVPKLPQLGPPPERKNPPHPQPANP